MSSRGLDAGEDGAETAEPLAPAIAWLFDVLHDPGELGDLGDEALPHAEVAR